MCLTLGIYNALGDRSIFSTHNAYKEHACLSLSNYIFCLYETHLEFPSSITPRILYCKWRDSPRIGNLPRTAWQAHYWHPCACELPQSLLSHPPKSDLQSVKVQRCSVLLFGNAPTMCKMTKFLHGNNFFPGRIHIFLSVYHVFSVLGRYESNLWVLVGTCRTLLKCNSLQQHSALWMNFKTILWVPGRPLLGQNT